MTSKVLSSRARVASIAARMGAILLVALLGACESFGPHYESERRDALRLAVAQGRFDQADALIAHHADFLDRGLALDFAIREGNVEGVRRYLDPGRVDAPLDTEGVTALMRAVDAAPDGRVLAIARVLLDAGADPGRANRAGETVRDKARARGHGSLVTLLDPTAEAHDAHPPRHIEWLPRVGSAVASASIGEVVAPARARGRAGRAGARDAWPPLPADRSESDWLLGRLWRPVLDVATAASAWHALRFHAGGSGDLVAFDPSHGPPARVADSHVAWEYYRGRLFVFVLAPAFAAYCESSAIAGSRVALRCDDYEVAGARWLPAPAGLLSDVAARSLLRDSGERTSLRRSGATQSVLEDDSGRSCRPNARARNPAAAGRVGRGPGTWVVADAHALRAFEGADARSQAQARAAAWRACRGSGRGARCRDVGGCAAGLATAAAGVTGHDTASLACAPSLDEARQQALDDCRRRAGCDCSLLVVEAPLSPEAPRAGSGPARSTRRAP